MDDLIRRQAAIDAVGNMLRRKFGIGGDLANITLAGLPSAQPTQTNTSNALKSLDCVSRQAAIDALGERPLIWSDGDEYAIGKQNQYDSDILALKAVPSIESEIAKEMSKRTADVIESVAKLARALTEALESERREDDAEIH